MELTRRQARRAAVREGLADWRSHRRVPLRTKRTLAWIMPRMYPDLDGRELICKSPLLDLDIDIDFYVPQRRFVITHVDVLSGVITFDLAGPDVPLAPAGMQLANPADLEHFEGGTL